MKKLFATSLTNSEVDNCLWLNSFVYETDIKGNIEATSEQEHVRWLIEKEAMENMYLQLKVALGKPN